MALQKDIQTPQGLTVPNAYIRIDRIEGDKLSLSVHMEAYVNKDAYTKGNQSFNVVDFSFAPDLTSTVNFIGQAYAFAKTLEAYTGAVDC